MSDSPVRQAVRTILSEVGEDPDREGLQETPARVARMFAESDPDFIRAMCSHLSSWPGYSGPMESMFRLHGRHDHVIPCPASGAEIVEAMTESDRFTDIRTTVERGNPEIQIVFQLDVFQVDRQNFFAALFIGPIHQDVAVSQVEDAPLTATERYAQRAARD